ncbi:UNVERIFIED_CONTAM: hypothetical protein K2H54_054596, partial [Gekko kuhli]
MPTSRWGLETWRLPPPKGGEVHLQTNTATHVSNASLLERPHGQLWPAQQVDSGLTPLWQLGDSTGRLCPATAAAALQREAEVNGCPLPLPSCSRAGFAGLEGRQRVSGGAQPDPAGRGEKKEASPKREGLPKEAGLALHVAPRTHNE